MRQHLLPTAALAAALFAPPTARAQDTGWRRVPLDAGASAEFPGAPKQLRDGPGFLFAGAGPTIYTALVTPAALPTDVPPDSARAALYRAQLTQLGDMKLVSQQPVEVAGAPGLDCVYRVPTDEGEVTNHERLVVLGDQLYTLTVGSRTPNAATTAANGQRFFNSLRPGPASADEAGAAATAAARTPATPDAAPAAHSPFSPATTVAGLLGGLGALWLIRRRRQANKPNA